MIRKLVRQYLLSSQCYSVCWLPPPRVAADFDPFRLYSFCQLSQVSSDRAFGQRSRDEDSAGALAILAY